MKAGRVAPVRTVAWKFGYGRLHLQQQHLKNGNSDITENNANRGGLYLPSVLGQTASSETYQLTDPGSNNLSQRESRSPYQQARGRDKAPGFSGGGGSGSNGGGGASGGSCGSSGASASITHLIVMANGLFGSPSNWSVICEQLGQHLDMSTVALHPSKVNRLTDTYDGIDVCGQRLADEIRSVAASHPSLQRISVIGHSMGGLLLRYAIGVLYNPATGRIAGLQPSHFITLATPHVGCDAEGLAQVPFIGWFSVRPVQRILQVLSVPTATLMFRRTGRQFFLADGSSSNANNNSDDNGNGNSSIPVRDNSGMISGSRRIGSSSITRNLRASASSPAVAMNAAAVTGPSSIALQPQTQAQSSMVTATANGLELTAATATATAAAAAANATAAAVPAATGMSLPLLYRMTHDEPERGLYFYSALASFASRTVYANTDGDHLVGWANSSLRFLHQLPRLPPETARARGVVMQDPLLAAFDVRGKPEAEPQHAIDGGDLPIDLPPADAADVDAARSENQKVTSTCKTTDGGGGAVTADNGTSSVAATAATAAVAELMLRRLQRLPWRRIDVSFQGARFGFAHNNIQVTRRWLNFEGITVAHHLARQVAALEAEWVRMQQMTSTTQVAAVVPKTGVVVQQVQQSGVPVQLQPGWDLQQQQQEQRMSPSGIVGPDWAQIAQRAEGAPALMPGAAAVARSGADGMHASGMAREQEPFPPEAEPAELLRTLGREGVAEEGVAVKRQ